MKKLYFFFLLLLLLGLVGTAHASVTVQVLATDFTNKTVTLHVEYANAVNDRAWVWIYLCSMQGMFEPAVISAASATGDNVAYTSTNTRGFFVTASPATITATLDNATGQFSCCAYGSDTPPNMTESNGTYTFKGTPPFTLIAADGATTQTVTGNTLPASALTMTPVFLTDETGYPSNFCPYTGSDLYNVAAYLCWQRSSGAQNWEAYIKDSRDNQIYRITQFSDNRWWFADDLAIADKSVGTCSGKRFYVGRDKPSCPNGWRLPTVAEWVSRYTETTGNTQPLANDSYGAPYAYVCYYGTAGAYNCGVNGCNECTERYDILFDDAVNTYVCKGETPSVCLWNCSRCQACDTGVGGIVRCMR
jgi:hypothetical protein